MIHTIAMRLYRILGILEKDHGFADFDGLHRQVLNAVIEASMAGRSITNQEIVDLVITSRSSTYRKIGDLKAGGFLVDHWQDGLCYLNVGPKCQEHFDRLGAELEALNLGKA